MVPRLEIWRAWRLGLMAVTHEGERAGDAEIRPGRWALLVRLSNCHGGALLAATLLCCPLRGPGSDGFQTLR
jgi:hypothetical protein